MRPVRLPVQALDGVDGAGHADVVQVLDGGLARAAVMLATFILSQTTESGTSTWFEGVFLLAVYAISAAAVYCVP